MRASTSQERVGVIGLPGQYAIERWHRCRRVARIEPREPAQHIRGDETGMERRRAIRIGESLGPFTMGAVELTALDEELGIAGIVLDPSRHRDDLLVEIPVRDRRDRRERKADDGEMDDANTHRRAPYAGDTLLAKVLVGA